MLLKKNINFGPVPSSDNIKTQSIFMIYRKAILIFGVLLLSEKKHLEASQKAYKSPMQEHSTLKKAPIRAQHGTSYYAGMDFR